MNNDYSFEAFFGLIVLSSFILSTVLLTIEMFIVKEIRFYTDRLEKEWALFGTNSIEYKYTHFRGISSRFASSKSFMYIHKPNWYHYKCCGYDEHLLSPENKDKANALLARLSYRDINEFQNISTELNLFQKQ